MCWGIWFACTGLFAGAPAPTGSEPCAVPVGAGMPAKKPAQDSSHVADRKLLSQMIDQRPHRRQ
ncbi:hypothetical protein GEV39_25205 [Pseudomonas sp. NY5710]|nr:hypothetical protein GEV39_25205 [Pseudomonas sp. NY5710]